MEEDCFIQSVEKFGAESTSEFCQDGFLSFRCNVAVAVNPFQQILTSQVGSEDNDRVFEVNSPSLRIGYSPVIQNLEQDIKDIRMCFFNLIKEDNAVWFPAHSFCQLTAFIVTYVSRRSPDQTGDREFFHVLCHINSDNIMFVVKQAFGQRFGKLRFAHARGTQEQEGTDRFVRIRDSSTGTQDRFGYPLHGFILTDYALMQKFIKMQDLLAFAFHQFGNRDSRPLCYDGRYFFLCYSIMHHCVSFTGFSQLLSLGKLFLKCRKIGIPQFCRFFIFIHALCIFNVCMHFFNFCFKCFNVINAVFLFFPASFLCVELLFQIGKILTQLCKTILRELVIFFFESHLFNFQPHDFTAGIIQFGRHGIYLRANHGTGFIHKIDGFVRKKTVGNIPVRKRSCSYERIVVYSDTMVNFIALFEPSQDRNGIFHSGFIYLNRLETSFKGSVLLNVFPVFI